MFIISTGKIRLGEFSCVILAAGRGKRMRPFSHKVPKPMLPLLNKPILSIIIERMQKIGAKDFVIITSKDNYNEIKSFFDTNYDKKRKIEIKYVIQDPPRGTAEAIYLGALEARTETIFSVAGDNLFSKQVFASMLAAFHQSRIDCLLAVKKVPKIEMTKLACVEVDKDQFIKSITEKPNLEEITSDFASISLYVFNKNVLTYFNKVKLSKRGELEAPDAFIAMIRSNLVLKAHPCSEQYIHISEPDDLWLYNMKFSKGKNVIDKSSSVDKTATLINCVIGQLSNIKSGVRLDHCLILPNTTIEQDLSFRNAVIIQSKGDDHDLEVYHITQTK